MREFYLNNKEKIDRVLFFILVAVFFYLFFTVFFVYLSPFFFGLIIALIMEPLNRLLNKKLRFKRWISSLVCLLLFIGIIGSIGVWVGTILVRQVVSFAENLPTHIEGAVERLDEANLWIQRFTQNLPEGWYIPDIEEMLPAAFGVFFGEGMREAGLRALIGVPDFVINVILGLVSAYFFMADGKRIFGFLKKSCPEWILKQMNHAKRGLKRALGGYFRAQGILMAMVFVISIVGLLIIGNDYALLIGLLFAVLDFLPILGPALILLPWAAVSLIVGNMFQGIGLLIIWAVITIARQVLQPKILGSQMGVHPLASLMSIFIGFRIFGLLGLIIGPTLLMIFIAIWDTKDEEAEPCIQPRKAKSG